MRSVPFLLALALLAAPALAMESPLTESAAADLKPGAYLWRPDLVPAGQVQVVISIPRQIAWVYRADTLIGIAAVSTGKPGHGTPTGAFAILEKREFHRSNLYSNAPMPFMQRLTWGGVALHAGHNPGFATSHGCIRLPAAFAKLLFKETALGANVVVTGEAIGVEAPRREVVTAVPDAAATPAVLLGESIPVTPLPIGTAR